MRRLEQELGIRTRLEFVYKFTYRAEFDDAGSENEFCSVYLGRCDTKPRVNETEIAEWRFVSTAELEQEFIDRPDLFTPWFKLEWRRLSGDFQERLAAYTDAVKPGISQRIGSTRCRCPGSAVRQMRRPYRSRIRCAASDAGRQHACRRGALCTAQSQYRRPVPRKR